MTLRFKRHIGPSSRERGILTLRIVVWRMYIDMVGWNSWWTWGDCILEESDLYQIKIVKWNGVFQNSWVRDLKSVVKLVQVWNCAWVDWNIGKHTRKNGLNMYDKI